MQIYKCTLLSLVSVPHVYMILGLTNRNQITIINWSHLRLILGGSYLETLIQRSTCYWWFTKDDHSNTVYS